MTELTKTLSSEERAELKMWETIIADGCKHFMAVGNALLSIRDGKLYRETHKTFECYLKERWGISRPTGYQHIQAAKTVKNLSAVADILPDNEAQTRPLSPLKPNEQQEAWKQVLSRSHNKPTAQIVEEVVAEYRPVRTLRTRSSASANQASNEPVTAKPPLLLTAPHEESACDYMAQWHAERERAEGLQRRVVALEEEVAELRARLAVHEKPPTTQAQTDEAAAAHSEAGSPYELDARCPLCGADDLGACPCDVDAVNAALKKAA